MTGKATITVPAHARRGAPVTVPIGRDYRLDMRPDDATIRCMICSAGETDSFSVVVELMLHTDGTVSWVETRDARPADRAFGWYTAFGFRGHPNIPATEAQARYLAGLYLGHGRDADPYAMGTPNAEVCRWAFAGMTPQQVSERYGAGERVFLA